VSVHGDHASDTRAARTGAGAELRILAARRLSRRVVNRADAIVSVHPDPLVNLPAKPRRFTYIPTIVDEAFRTVHAAPLEGRVLFCGGARRIKGADLLAAAWPEVTAAVPGARLEVVGWPPGGELPQQLDAAEVRGRLDSTELAAAMARAAAVVIPSRFEVAPVTILEAWAVGVPVVATRVGGVPALAEGAAALAEAEPGAIAAALVRTLDGGAPVAELVAEGGRRAEEATPAAVARAHLAIYEDLVS
jgi:glycosyltransferase involved in cell wall biosynthesis